MININNQKITTFILFFISINLGFAQDFKTIGYLPYYRFSLNDQIQYEKITHLNIAFANPDMQGNLSVGGADITPIVQSAHAADVEVYISLAGGALTSDWAAAWEHLIQFQNRSAFIQKIIDYTLNHNLQGIDVDLEWSHVNADYSGFVLELRDSVDKYDIGLTAALPGTYRYPQITDAALAAYDWINMMVYDLTGPWNPSNPGPHSPYSFALNAIDYWVNQGVPKNKLTLGVPFYGYDFTDQGNVTALTYSQIVAMNPDNAQVDQVGQIYYNGMPTIEAKITLALDEVSGIMIWELGQDRFDEYSLLDVIYEVIQMSISTINELQEIDVKFFPNPFENEIQFHNTENLEGQVSLFDATGRMIFNQNLTSTENLDLSTLPGGIYVLSIFANGKFFSKKMMKK